MRILFIIFLATTIFSCNKELPDDFVPYNNSLQTDTVWKLNVPNTATVNNLFDIFTDHVSVQSFGADTGGTFIMNDSLKIEMPANALLKNGTPVSGLVTANISQYRTKGQMLAANISTFDNGQILETIGAFNVQFYKDNNPLTIAAGKKYTLKVKHLSGNMLQSVGAYYKDPNSTFQTIWASATDGSAAYSVPSGQGDPGYLLQMGNTGWLLAGKPVDITGSEKIRVNVIMPPGFTNANTIAFAVFTDHNAVVRLKPDVDSKSFYTEGVPSGKKIKIVTISKLADQYYFGSVDAVATKGNIIKVTPDKKASAKDIVSIVLNL